MWIETRIGNLFQNTTVGEWGTAPTPLNSVPVLRSTNMTNDGRIDTDEIVVRNVSMDRLQSKRVNRGDILVEKSGGGPQQPAGRVAYCDFDFGGTCSNFIEIARVSDDYDSRFVFYLLYYLYQSGLVLKYQQQTTGIINFKFKEYQTEIVRVPISKSEQTAIADILATVDRAIAQSKALIAKQRRIKAGLLHDLLTRGIDEQGNLRHPATHRFKPSPVGPVPVEWEVKQVRDFSEVVRGSSPRPKGDPKYYGGTVPRLMVEDITRDGKYVTPLVDFLTEAGAKLSRPLKAGSLVVVCSGTVGIPAILAVDACIHDGLLGFSRVSEAASVEFLYHLFWYLQAQFDSSATHGGIFTNLTTTIMKEFSVALPDITEQVKVVHALKQADNLSKTLDDQLAKLHRLKSGLMQDLLSGRVSVAGG